MDTKAYIESGVIELYVAGQLTEEENLEVAQNAKMYPEIEREIIAVEKAFLSLSATAAPEGLAGFEGIRQTISETDTDMDSPKKGTRSLKPYLGWAAAVVLTMGLVHLYLQNQQLSSGIEVSRSQIEQLEQQIREANQSLEESNALLEELRAKDILVVSLEGQQIAPDSYAKAYWNKRKGQLLIDAQGLPEPPQGMAYQVWSLTLDPLTPTSVGLLENFANDGNGVFALVNTNASEAFGITLEPEGGSATPNLEQLYVLGTVSS